MTVYIKAEDSICVHKKTVKMEDVADVLCDDKELEMKVKKTELYHFTQKNVHRVVLSVLKLAATIRELDASVDIANLGPTDFIVYYKQQQKKPPWINKIKFAAVALVAFFGSSFSIMSYNTDVGIEDLFTKMYFLIMGKMPDGPNILYVSYAIGLAVGILVFFNHAGSLKFSEDPTPFEVQMRLYERDVNDTLMMNASRKNQEEESDG